MVSAARMTSPQSMHFPGYRACMIVPLWPFDVLGMPSAFAIAWATLSFPGFAYLLVCFGWNLVYQSSMVFTPRNASTLACISSGVMLRLLFPVVSSPTLQAYIPYDAMSRGSFLDPSYAPRTFAKTSAA